LLSREDVVRTGAKRPPLAAGINADGNGRMRAARTPGLADAVHAVAPRISVEELDVPGPPTSLAIRGAGWAEVKVMLAVLEAMGDGARAGEGGPVSARAPSGGTAVAVVDGSGVHVRVACGDALDPVVLRWVRSEGLAVDEEGRPQDLTIRSFGILRAQDMPAVEVDVAEDPGPPVNGSDAVFAAVAGAAWLSEGLAPEWPTRRTRS